SGSRAIHGLRRQGHAGADHRLCAEPPGPEARRWLRDHVAYGRCRRGRGGRQGALPDRRGPGPARDPRSASRRHRRPQGLLRDLVHRNRGHARRVGADRATALGEGARLSPPHGPACRPGLKRQDGMSSFNQERWKVVSPYLDRAMEMAGPELEAWLASLRAKDADLAGDVEALLRERSALSHEGFLEGTASGPPATASLSGHAFGAYTLVSRIGQGGMG